MPVFGGDFHEGGDGPDVLRMICTAIALFVMRARPVRTPPMPRI